MRRPTRRCWPTHDKQIFSNGSFSRVYAKQGAAGVVHARSVPDHELTDIGRPLVSRVKILGKWAFENLPSIAAA